MLTERNDEPLAPQTSRHTVCGTAHFCPARCGGGQPVRRAVRRASRRRAGDYFPRGKARVRSGGVGRSAGAHHHRCASAACAARIAGRRRAVRGRSRDAGAALESAGIPGYAGRSVRRVLRRGARADTQRRARGCTAYGDGVRRRCHADHLQSRKEPPGDLHHHARAGGHGGQFALSGVRQPDKVYGRFRGQAAGDHLLAARQSERRDVEGAAAGYAGHSRRYARADHASLEVQRSDALGR